MMSLIAFSLFGVALGQVIEPRNTCGTIPSFMTGDRIVGGQAASSPIPWQVSVRQGQSGGGHFCGGTILDAKTVMCAAHCFTTGQSMNGYYITAGITNRNSNSGAQTIGIDNGVWNSAMPYSGNNNDFVILKLSSALTFNTNVGAACLPEPGFAPDTTGQTCFVSGWGTLNSGANSLPTNLQWVGVPTVTNSQCAQAYPNTITNSMICAGLPNGGKDSCQGDSGGPFICRKDGKAVLTGVVSFGIGCALADYPGVYARVTAVLDWVKANMETGSGPNPTTSAPSPTTTSAPSPTTTSPPSSGCGSPQWATDEWCDDENNNADCNYDGGACCSNAFGGWDSYCIDCECKDPNNVEDDCVDIWSTGKCVRRKNRGRCNRKWVQKNCEKTCEVC